MGVAVNEVVIAPPQWVMTNLRSVVTLQRGHDLTNEQRRDGNIPVMSAAGEYGTHDTAVANGPGVVVGRSGASIGQVHYCKLDYWPHNTALYVTSFHGNDELFTYYFLQSLDLRRYNSGGAQPSLNRNFVYPLEVKIPPRPEQEAIAEALSDVDGLIGALEALIAKKRAIKQAAMQQLLTAKTRLPGFTCKWTFKRIGEFTDCTAGGTPSTLVPQYWGGSIPWMNSGELNLRVVREVDGRITESGLRESSTKMLPLRCVLVGLAGQGKTRGTVALNLLQLSTNQSIAAIFPNPSFVPEYLYYHLDSRYEELRMLSAGDGGRGGLNLRLIRSLGIPFPHLDEQEAIAAVLSDMDAEITALEQRLYKTRAIKQGMMQQLLTGRTRLIKPEGRAEATC